MASVVMIQDHTSQVNFYQTKRREELLQMVNACVSHEMKNPINSIQGYNLKQSELSEELLGLVRKEKLSEEVRGKLQDVVQEMVKCT